MSTTISTATVSTSTVATATVSTTVSTVAVATISITVSVTITVTITIPRVRTIVSSSKISTSSYVISVRYFFAFLFIKAIVFAWWASLGCCLFDKFVEVFHVHTLVKTLDNLKTVELEVVGVPLTLTLPELISASNVARATPVLIVPNSII